MANGGFGGGGEVDGEDWRSRRVEEVEIVRAKKGLTRVQSNR